MSDYEHQTDRRECRHCGALLSTWECDVCGGDSFEAITDTYVSELAMTWRYGDDGFGDSLSQGSRLVA
jgi:hypothetical protein